MKTRSVSSGLCYVALRSGPRGVVGPMFVFLGRGQGQYFSDKLNGKKNFPDENILIYWVPKVRHPCRYGWGYVCRKLWNLESLKHHFMHFGGRFYRILMVRKRRIYIEIATLVKLLKLVFLFLLNKIGMFLANKLLNICPTKFLFVTLTLEESPPPPNFLGFTPPPSFSYSKYSP